MDIGILQGEQTTDLTSCREAILSNEYADYLISYNGDQADVQAYFAGQCLKFIDDYLAVVTVPREDTNLMDVVTQLYYMIPKCYGLMDPTSLEESGIIRVQNQPVLRLRGEGTLIGVIDTGERVIIMSS